MRPSPALTSAGGKKRPLKVGQNQLDVPAIRNPIAMFLFIVRSGSQLVGGVLSLTAALHHTVKVLRSTNCYDEPHVPQSRLKFPAKSLRLRTGSGQLLREPVAISRHRSRRRPLRRKRKRSRAIIQQARGRVCSPSPDT